MSRKGYAICLALVMFCNFLVIIFHIAPLVRSDIIYVDDNGEGDYTNIQDAINAANPGDTVFVYEGLYKETIIVNKTINVIGKNAENTTIEGWREYVVNITSDSVNLINFTINIRHTGAYWGTGGIGLYNVQGCSVAKNKISPGDEKGIYLYSSSNNNITGNIINDGIEGINIHNSNYNCIADNIISNTYDNGVGLLNSGNNNITNNIFSHNKDDSIALKHSNDNKIKSNSFSKNSIGILLQNSDNNIIEYNEIDNTDHDGIILQSSSKNHITNNDVSYCSDGIHLYKSSDNTIKYNNITNNKNGISLIYSPNNNVDKNSYKGNARDINEVLDTIEIMKLVLPLIIISVILIYGLLFIKSVISKRRNHKKKQSPPKLTE